VVFGSVFQFLRHNHYNYIPSQHTGAGQADLAVTYTHPPCQGAAIGPDYCRPPTSRKPGTFGFCNRQRKPAPGEEEPASILRLPEANTDK
jgi:hypothetical protein